MRSIYDLGQVAHGNGIQIRSHLSLVGTVQQEGNNGGRDGQKTGQRSPGLGRGLRKEVRNVQETKEMREVSVASYRGQRRKRSTFGTHRSLVDDGLLNGLSLSGLNVRSLALGGHTGDGHGGSHLGHWADGSSRRGVQSGGGGNQRGNGAHGNHTTNASNHSHSDVPSLGLSMNTLVGVHYVRRLLGLWEEI